MKKDSNKEMHEKPIGVRETAEKLTYANKNALMAIIMQHARGLRNNSLKPLYLSHST